MIDIARISVVTRRRPGRWMGAPFSVSAVSYMEVVQGVHDGSELRALRRSFRFWGAEIPPFNEAISARAMFFVEEFSFSHDMSMADALIAASALYLGEPLLTANDRHYRHIRDLDLRVFRP